MEKVWHAFEISMEAREGPSPFPSTLLPSTTTVALGERRLLALAFFLRVALIIYGAVHDHFLQVPYTDVDYHVFSDAAALVHLGDSPYGRGTYRYTPLLALSMLPTVLWAAFGKAVFVLCDLVVGAQIHAVLIKRRVPLRAARMCMNVWLYNPLSLNVSTRGNYESMVSALLLGALHRLILHHRALLWRITASATLLALAVHLKPYPMIYLPAFYVAVLDAGFTGSVLTSSTSHASFPPPPTAAPKASKQQQQLPPHLRFVATFTAVLAALLAASCLWCGEDYLREALFYHLSRQDQRHNFSPYFLPLFLSSLGTVARSMLGALAFAPQLALLLACAWRLGSDLPFCMLVQTLVFVAFNKVCTAQYFIWYLALLPLCLPSTAALHCHHQARAVHIGAAWVLALLLWLGCAYLLEFRGCSIFVPLWLASISFFAANILLIREVLTLHRPTPLFEAGGTRLARQACLM